MASAIRTAVADPNTGAAELRGARTGCRAAEKADDGRNLWAVPRDLVCSRPHLGYRDKRPVLDVFSLLQVALTPGDMCRRWIDREQVVRPANSCKQRYLA